MGELPCSLDGGVDSSNHQFPRQTDRDQDTEGHDPTAEASRQAQSGTDSGRPLGVGFTQLRFQPGAFRISATGTVTDALYHKHNLYLITGPNWTICRRMYIGDVVASVCRLVSLMGTICSSVVVQHTPLDMYKAIHSCRGCRSMR